MTQSIICSPALLNRPLELVCLPGRIGMHRKRVNISTVLAGQRLGIKEVDDGIWIVSFMHYDIGFIGFRSLVCLCRWRVARF